MIDTLAIILKDTYTLTQIKTRVSILKSSLLKGFFGGENQSSVSPQDLTWLKSLPPAFLQQITKDNVYHIFADLEKRSSNLPTLTAYLTFEPDNAVISQIGQTARASFSIPNLLLDIRLDPSLMGGAALVWKGVYKDYSLRSKVEGKKEEILQEFKKFLR